MCARAGGPLENTSTDAGERAAIACGAGLIWVSCRVVPHPAASITMAISLVIMPAATASRRPSLETARSTCARRSSVMRAATPVVWCSSHNPDLGSAYARRMSSDAPLSGPDLAAGIPDADLREGVPLLGHAHGEAIVLVRDEGRVHAVGATCTHYGGPLAEGLVDGGAIHCPWHHACFDLATGARARARRSRRSPATTSRSRAARSASARASEPEHLTVPAGARHRS